MSASLAADIRERILNDEVAKPDARPGPVRTTYGYVVVDEAQDLSPMQWRMVARRCPSGSMTLVGDLDQASGGWRLTWDEVLRVAAPDAPAGGQHVAELTVNYRTPAEVMALASRVLAAARSGPPAPVAVRESGNAPTFESVKSVDVAVAAARA
ncbi:MAG TPA: UvrD-helicase domain-containing protein, partial [Acidimicrobiales bacterium]